MTYGSRTDGPVYYNEIDKYCCDVIKECIKSGILPEGDVDNRSILDVRPSDVKGYRHAHFFAGLGLWALVLERTNWFAGSEEAKTWTGSCPCQPFSSAGKTKGFEDERHLWPAWFSLIEKCRPKFLFGEQVGSTSGLAWFNLVQSDLEAKDYAVGGLDLCAAGFGAPHIRQRLYWFASNASDAEWDIFAREEPCDRRIEGVGRFVKSSPWTRDWQGALACLRTLDDGDSFVLPATDAIRNAISPRVAEEFVEIVKDIFYERGEHESLRH